MELYEDDMITNRIKETNNVQDLEETFKILMHYGMKLNPKKSTFEVRSKKVLGYVIDQREMKSNPNKV